VYNALQRDTDLSLCSLYNGCDRSKLVSVCVVVDSSRICVFWLCLEYDLSVSVYVVVDSNTTVSWQLVHQVSAVQLRSSGIFLCFVVATRVGLVCVGCDVTRVCVACRKNG
jgi:hypothetical protein